MSDPQKPESGGDGEFSSLVFGGPHFYGRALNAVVAPVTLCALETFAETALVANKNLVIGFPNGAHLTFSIGFAALARGI
jgi:hypothetical protein